MISAHTSQPIPHCRTVNSLGAPNQNESLAVDARQAREIGASREALDGTPFSDSPLSDRTTTTASLIATHGRLTSCPPPLIATHRRLTSGSVRPSPGSSRCCFRCTRQPGGCSRVEGFPPSPRDPPLKYSKRGLGMPVGCLRGLRGLFPCDPPLLFSFLAETRLASCLQESTASRPPSPLVMVVRASLTGWPPAWTPSPCSATALASSQRSASSCRGRGGWLRAWVHSMQRVGRMRRSSSASLSLTACHPDIPLRGAVYTVPPFVCQ